MAYCDTSLIVALLTREVHTDAALAWLRRSERLHATSAWVDVEVSSALFQKVRLGEIDVPFAQDRLATWRGLTEERFERVAIDAATYAEAANILEQARSPLRAGDALHLAIARLSGNRLATLDRAMAVAAEALGIGVEPVFMT